MPRFHSVMANGKAPYTSNPPPAPAKSTLRVPSRAANSGGTSRGLEVVPPDGLKDEAAKAFT
ncbi:hypothetical protein L3i22_037400 [Actinoplanes sp. L3-i22]|nr:hypothetical protein L3i22_037400 [Actinoplanes sp. L3-i22]